MKRIFFWLVCALLAMGCAQPTPNSTSNKSASANATAKLTGCVGEGGDLGAVIPDNNRQCCPGMLAYVPPQTAGSRGTCLKPEEIPNPGAANGNASSNNGVANPAAVFCQKQGFNSSPDGNCLFLDHSSCEQWAFFRGTCGQAFTDCQKNNGTIESRSETIADYSATYAVCIFDDGSQCPEAQYAAGICKKSQCKKWTMASGCSN